MLPTPSLPWYLPKYLRLSRRYLWAAAFNFLAYFLIKDHKVANTIAKTVHENFITMHVILAGLCRHYLEP
jgi:PiT family inorganic phosphate transporter